MKCFTGLFSHPSRIALLILIVLALIYLVMLWNTNSIFYYTKSVFLGEVPYEEIENSLLSIYDDAYTRKGVEKVDLEIHRVFVIHDFFDGYMWISYDYIGYDENDKMIFLSTQEYPFLAKWTIHRENGEWVIVDIDEHP